MTRASAPTLWLVLAFASLLFSAAPSLSAQENQWKKHIKDGDEAFRSYNSAKAEKQFQAALDQTRTFPPNDLRTAETLIKLANVYAREMKWSEAEKVCKQAEAILEESAGPDDPQLAYVLIDLALAFDAEHQPEQAAPLWPRAIAILKKAGKPLDLAVLDSMNQEANRLSGMDISRFPAEDDAEAEQIFLSVRELEESLGASDRELTDALRGLVRVYERTAKLDAQPNRLADAEPLETRILQIDEKAFGPYSGAAAVDVGSLADLYTRERKYAAALPPLQRELEIAEKNNQPDTGAGRTHKNIATAVNDTALVAELPLIILSQGAGAYLPMTEVRRPDEGEIVRASRQLARGYANAGKYPEAEETYQQIITIDRKAASDPGITTNTLADDLKDLAIVYRDDRRYDEAVDTMKASEVAEQQFADSKFMKARPNSDLPRIELWFIRIELAETYREKGDLAGAEPLFQQSLDMVPDLKIVPGHPKLAELQDHYATLLRDEGKDDQAESLYKGSLDTWQKSRGQAGTPEFAETLTNYAVLLRKLNRPGEAEPLEAQAAAIRAKIR